MSKNQFLIVLRAGDTSIHKEWLEPRKDINFDLFIDYFGNQHDMFKEDATYYKASKGIKWPIIFSLIKSYKSIISDYKAVWFPDDDLSTNSANINKMFNLFAKYNLLLAQPALTKDSYFSHNITLRREATKLRFTNFVEVMAPIFSQEALRVCYNTFPRSISGWGLDLIWPKILGYPTDKIAIIDETPIKHTRPVGLGSWYKTLNISPYQEMSRLIAQYDIKDPFNFTEHGSVISNNF
jgi:hypothetical protein